MDRWIDRQKEMEGNIVILTGTQAGREGEMEVDR